MDKLTKIIRLKDVQYLTGLGKTTIYTLENRGQFPSRRRLTSRASGWLEADVIEWIEALPINGKLES